MSRTWRLGLIRLGHAMARARTLINIWRLASFIASLPRLLF
jgi:hypothetical protein